MWKTIIRRICIMIPQLLIVSILVFMLGQLMPGDPYTGLMAGNVKAEAIEQMREKAGLNDPIPKQYVRWFKNFLQGDFGKSYTLNRPVVDLIGERVWNTFSLSLLTTLLLYGIAIPLGIIAGRYNNSIADKIISLYNFISYAIPSFLLALVFLLIFGFKLGWFPTRGSVEIGLDPGTFAYYISRLKHMLLPAITYAILATTGVIQYLRNEIIDAKTMDYVKTARSKGVSTSKIYSRHIFRNSLLPIAAFFGFTVTGLLAGSVFIETIFGYPGMGELFVSSISSNDYSTIMALTMLFGFLGVMGSLISDIILSLVDPRIRID